MDNENIIAHAILKSKLEIIADRNRRSAIIQKEFDILKNEINSILVDFNEKMKLDNQPLFNDR